MPFTTNHSKLRMFVTHAGMGPVRQDARHVLGRKALVCAWNLLCRKPNSLTSLASSSLSHMPVGKRSDATAHSTRFVHHPMLRPSEEPSQETYQRSNSNGSNSVMKRGPGLGGIRNCEEASGKNRGTPTASDPQESGIGELPWIRRCPRASSIPV